MAGCQGLPLWSLVIVTSAEARRPSLGSRWNAIHHVDEPANGHQTEGPALRCRASSRFTHVFERKPMAIRGMPTGPCCPALPRKIAVFDGERRLLA